MLGLSRLSAWPLFKPGQQLPTVGMSVFKQAAVHSQTRAATHDIHKAWLLLNQNQNSLPARFASAQRSTRLQAQAAFNRRKTQAIVQSYVADRQAAAAVLPSPPSKFKFPIVPPRYTSDYIYAQADLPDRKSPGFRLRQHVNPFRPDLQVIPDPIDWSKHFHDPERPLILDLGCASGRFLLGLARFMPQCNFMGLEIRYQLVSRANEWAQRLGVSDSVHFRLQNATIAVDALLKTYPGPLQMACILCPDPQFKKKHHKRRLLQSALAKQLAERLRPGGHIYINSDVLEVAIDMRRHFEAEASSILDVAPEHDDWDTFRVSEYITAANGQADDAAAELAEHHSPSVWAKHGWLAKSPLGLETERELSVLRQNLPMYRMLLTKQL